MAWLALKSFHQKRSGESVLLLTQKFQHIEMVEGEELYEHLTTMLNLPDKLEEVTRSKVTEEDFMTMVCVKPKIATLNSWS